MVFLKRFSARDLIFYLLAILVMVFTFNAVQQMNEPDDPTYNEIRLLFEQEKVKYFSVEDNVLTLTLRGEGEDTSTLKYHLADFNVFYNDLHELIDSQRQAGIIQDYDYPAGWAEPWWFAYVPYLVILLGFGILMYTMYLRQNTGGGGGGEGGAAGDRRVSPGPGALHRSGCPHPQGRAAGGPSRHGQDPHRQGGGRGGRGPLSVHLRL